MYHDNIKWILSFDASDLFKEKWRKLNIYKRRENLFRKNKFRNTNPDDFLRVTNARSISSTNNKPTNYTVFFAISSIGFRYRTPAIFLKTCRSQRQWPPIAVTHSREPLIPFLAIERTTKEIQGVAGSMAKEISIY